jgi:ribosomal protein S18 acetylase RimI-like enzyme
MVINGEILGQHHEAKPSVLINGELVILRLMEKSDGPELMSFFEALPEKEVESLQDDVKDAAVISRWTESLDYRSVLPLLALDEFSRHIVGVGTLHFMHGVHRHIADIRVVVSRKYRKLGLGSTIIKELLQIGTQLGLHFIKAEIMMDNPLAIKAFRQLGFDYLCTIDGYFMARSGKTQNVAMMLKRLRFDMEEDFFFQF